MNADKLPTVTTRDVTPWAGITLGKSAVPTMLSDEELRYLTWLGAEAWTGRGTILEIGPWLGGSTRALAEGVRRTAHARPGVLTSMDNFVWKSFMAKRSGLSLKEGESFLPYFQKNLAEFGGIVTPLQSYLPDEAVEGDPDADEIRSTQVSASDLFRWPAERPLELLFVDGAKSYHGLKYLLAETGDSLMPNLSLLIFQDYKYWGTYWVPLITELLETHLELVHVLRSNTVTFRLKIPLRRADVESLPALNALEWSRGLELLERAANRLERAGDPAGGAIVRVAQVRFLIHKGRRDDAQRVFRLAEQRWPGSAPDANFERCRRWLEGRLEYRLGPTWSRRIKRLWSRRRKH
jgi:hypothetical protein